MRTRQTKLLLGLLMLFIISGFPVVSAEEKTPYDHVDPFIGTDEMGHTFPGATVPFGMVQLSPDTGSEPFYKQGKYNKEVYRYCAGYQYRDKTIVGFSHTHFNGTGHSDLGDFLVIPILGKLMLEPGEEQQPESGYRSRFSHKTEEASPGFYHVRLEDYRIDVDLTATTRAGFHQYTFLKKGDAHIILDLVHGIYNYDGKVIWSSVRVVNDTLVTGSRHTSGWGRSRHLFFAMKFSKPFGNYRLINSQKRKYSGFWGRSVKENGDFPLAEGKRIRAHFDYDVSAGDVILVKVGISAVSAAGALKNLESEIPHWDFHRTRNEAKEMWRRELGRVVIDAPERMKKIFHTSHYRTCLGPVIYMDVDRRYRGLDGEIHTAEGFDHYTIFSLWDTYRAQHPWLTIVQPDRVRDMIRSMLAHYEQSPWKMLPIWSFHGNENWCMTGYHGVSVISDAYVKGIRGFDKDLAFKAVVDTATSKRFNGLGNYMTYGYVPGDLEFGANSASKTLEYAYDDFAVYAFARALGRKETAGKFYKRAENYKNIFSRKDRMMRARLSDGSFLEPFDSLKTTGMGFIEGNSWNFTLHVPHDVGGLTKLLNGKKRLGKMLDDIFSMHTPDDAYEDSEDIESSGILGGYIHGNEPSHHIPYLYHWAGDPWKTQEIVHKIMDSMYTVEPDGLPGNDDCGQMSAWYIFGAMGFYPVCPGTDQYVIGSPCVKKLLLKLENRKVFSVEAINLSERNIYIQSARLNGKSFNRGYITHREIVSGGRLEFVMSSEPNKSWATSSESMPFSLSRQKPEM